MEGIHLGACPSSATYRWPKWMDLCILCRIHFRCTTRETVTYQETRGHKKIALVKLVSLLWIYGLIVG
jgi:hypothetical protein